MKSKIKYIFLSFILLFQFNPAFASGQEAAAPADEKEKVEVAVFTLYSCVHCQKMKNEFMPAFMEKNKDKAVFKDYEISEPESGFLFDDTLGNIYNIKDPGVPCMIIGSKVLMGYPTEIGTGAQQALDEAYEKGEKTRLARSLSGTETALRLDLMQKEYEAQKAAEEEAAGKVALSTAASAAPDLTAHISTAAAASPSGGGLVSEAERRLQNFSLAAIIGAGLADGINPCAFAVIVFFISFLTVYKYERREIIAVGIMYCLAVFLTYLALGLGLMKALYALEPFMRVRVWFNYFTIALCAVFFLLCLYDFIIYQKTKKSEKILLQLPKSYKIYIHKIMHFFMRDKKANIFMLSGAAFVVGIALSLIEAVCTGQVYLPTINIILNQSDRYFARALNYLLLYNLMFIVPLVLIFVLALCGFESKIFNDFLKNHLGATKFLLCLVFLALLIYSIMIYAG